LTKFDVLAQNRDGVVGADEEERIRCDVDITPWRQTLRQALAGARDVNADCEACSGFQKGAPR
jgi:hypothetical protein